MRSFREFARRHERACVFAAVVALFAAVYVGTAVFAAFFLTPRILHEDPVWRMPFMPGFVIAYSTAYVFPLLLFATPYDPPAFRRFALIFAIDTVVSGIGFIALPMTLPRPPLGDAPFESLLALTYAIDVPGNLFPSLHVSTALIIALAIGHSRPAWRWPALAWATVIAASTLLVRQHYLVDVIGGALLAAILWILLAPSPSRTGR